MFCEKFEHFGRLSSSLINNNNKNESHSHFLSRHAELHDINIVVFCNLSNTIYVKKRLFYASKQMLALSFAVEDILLVISYLLL